MRPGRLITRVRWSPSRGPLGVMVGPHAPGLLDSLPALAQGALEGQGGATQATHAPRLAVGLDGHRPTAPKAEVAPARERIG